MKIVILHGPGEVRKRAEALRIKKQYPPDNISQLDLKVASPANLEVQLTSSPLFVTGEGLLVVENVPDKLDLQEFKSSDDNLTLLLLAGTPRADSLLLQSAKKMGAKIYLFEGEKELTAFPFLDSLLEGNKRAFVELEKLLSEYGAMYILAMIYYGLRRNLLPLPPSLFLKKKIVQQKQRYQEGDWAKLYYLTLQTEFAIKEGFAPERIGLTGLVEAIISRRFEKDIG